MWPVDPRGRAIVLARLDERAFGVLAYETNGTLAWATAYRDPSDDADLATKLAIDAAGNVYAAGSWQRSNAPLGGFLVVSFDTAGGLRWTVRSEGGGALSWLAVDGEGRVVVTGGGSDGTHVLARTIAYDANGNIAWQASELGPLGLGATGRNVAIDADAHVYVAGEATDGSQDHFPQGELGATAARPYSSDLRRVHAMELPRQSSLSSEDEDIFPTLRQGWPRVGRGWADRPGPRPKPTQTVRSSRRRSVSRDASRLSL